jgi:class 3 adenylate cyclase
MTQPKDQPVVVEMIVVAFDMCSSSQIMEDLLLSGRLVALRNLILAVKAFLTKSAEELGFTIYKFMGDGWILLFPPSFDGAVLLSFLSDLCVLYREKFDRRVRRRLEEVPRQVGLKFGMDGGSLLKVIMNNKAEYIGHAINIACRLQSAIADNGENPAYRLLVSNHLYPDLGNVKAYRPVSRKRQLRNIIGTRDYRCKELDLLAPKETAHAA